MFRANSLKLDECLAATGASFRSRRRTIAYELILRRLQAVDLKL
jgi:hypothetical protein